MLVSPIQHNTAIFFFFLLNSDGNGMDSTLKELFIAQETALRDICWKSDTAIEEIIRTTTGWNEMNGNVCIKLICILSLGTTQFTIVERVPVTEGRASAS